MLISLRSALLICAALSRSRLLRPRPGRSERPVLPTRRQSARRSRSPSCSTRRPSRSCPSRTRLIRPRNRCAEETAAAVEPCRRRDLAAMVAAAARLRSRQPRARMPRDRHLFRIEERAADRPACGRPGHRQPRRSSGRFPSTYCGVLFQRSQFSFIRGRRCRRLRGRAVSGRPRSRSPRSSTRSSRTRRSARPCSSMRATCRRAGA